MTRDPRRHLEQAGARQTPAPDPAFADALEARLRAVAASLPPAAPAPKPATQGWRRGWVRGLAAGLVVTALVLAAVGQRDLTPTPSPLDPPLELTSAVNVVVELADGTTIDNPEGMILPEGATVTVGDGGSARIGTLTLTAGERAVVHRGNAQVERPRPITSGTALATPAPKQPSAPPPGASGSPAPSASPPASAPAGSSTPAPASPGPPGPPGPTTQPVPSPTTPPAPSPTPAATARPAVVLAPTLRARLVGARTIAVDWTRTAGARSYVLVMTRAKAGPAPRPVYPGGRVLGTFSRPPGSPVQFVLAPGLVQVKMIVVALDKNGNELARSRVVRIIVVAPVSSASPSPLPS
jgi:hypothetical protein